MIRTVLSHAPSCSQRKAVRQLPSSTSVGVHRFECSECGAVAASRQSADHR